jgi:hypothetical protein
MTERKNEIQREKDTEIGRMTERERE